MEPGGLVLFYTSSIQGPYWSMGGLFSTNLIQEPYGDCKGWTTKMFLDPAFIIPPLSAPRPSIWARICRLRSIWANRLLFILALMGFDRSDDSHRVSRWCPDGIMLQIGVWTSNWTDLIRIAYFREQIQNHGAGML